MKWQNMKTDARNVAEECTAYIKRNRYVLFFMALAVLLIHGAKLNSVNVGIDTEKIIFNNWGLYEGWLGIGRQGLVFLKILLETTWFNPFFAGILTVLLLMTSYISFSFLFEYIQSRQGRNVEHKGYRWLTLGFGLIVIAHPILTEQLYFTLQSAEVLAAVTLVALSLLCACLWADGKNFLWLIPAALMMLIPFSVYQAMVPLYLFGAVAVLCLRAFGSAEITIKKEFGYALRHAVAFLIGFAANQIITSLFFSTSSYVTGQVAWGTEDFAEGIRHILSHVKAVVTGDGVFYFRNFFVISLLLIIAVIAHMLRRKGQQTGQKIWQVLMLIALLASPFYLTLVLGNRPVIRAQLSLPFITGFLVYLTGILLKGKWNILLAAVCVVTVWQEADNTARLYYTDAVRYEQDVLMADSLMREITKITGDKEYDRPVVFIGRWENEGNPSCQPGDVMGRSMFAWDTDVEPLYFGAVAESWALCSAWGRNMRRRLRSRRRQPDRWRQRCPVIRRKEV